MLFISCFYGYEIYYGNNYVVLISLGFDMH